MTYNIIAEEIAGNYDRPFDVMFKSRIKSEFRHILSLLLRQQINKYGILDTYKTRYTASI